MGPQGRRLIPVSADVRRRTTSRVASTTGVETLSVMGPESIQMTIVLILRLAPLLSNISGLRLIL